jgi:hypothetical protein
MIVPILCIVCKTWVLTFVLPLVMMMRVVMLEMLLIPPCLLLALLRRVVGVEVEQQGSLFGSSFPSFAIMPSGPIVV